MYSRKEQGQQGSPRGDIGKETGYVILMAVHTTREMLLGVGNNRVRLILPHNVVHDRVPGQIKLSRGSVFCIYLNQSLKYAAALSKMSHEGCGTSCRNNHRCSIFSPTPPSWDTDKIIKNGHIFTQKKWKRQYTWWAQTVLYTALNHCSYIHGSIHSISLAQICQPICCWQCPAAFHQRSDLPTRCCLMPVCWLQLVFRASANVLGAQRK